MTEKQDDLDELFCDEYDDFSTLEELCSNEGIGLGDLIPTLDPLEEPNTTENAPVNQHPLPSCSLENVRR